MNTWLEVGSDNGGSSGGNLAGYWPSALPSLVYERVANNMQAFLGVSTDIHVTQMSIS
jgi:hypothetical protein